MDPDIEAWWMLASIGALVALIIVYLVLAERRDTEAVVHHPMTADDEAKLHRRLMKRDLLRHEADCTYRQALGTEPCDCGVDA